MAGALPAGTVPAGHAGNDDVVPAFACVELPVFVGAFAGDVIGADGEPGVVAAARLGFTLGLGVPGLALVELEAVEFGAVEPGVGIDPLCAVPAATGTHGVPLALGTVAPGCPLAGIDEFICVPACGVACVSLPAALVVIDVGGPIVVMGGLAGGLGGVPAVGGGAFGVAGGGVDLLCPRTQLLHIRRTASKQMRVDTKTSGSETVSLDRGY